jgi:hypothetical protein
VKYLLITVDKVKVVKMDKGRTPYSIPLCKLCVLKTTTQQIFYRISVKGTYPFKYIYFDIIIKENRFNGDAYIVYF